MGTTTRLINITAIVVVVLAAGYSYRDEWLGDTSNQLEEKETFRLQVDFDEKKQRVGPAPRVYLRPGLDPGGKAMEYSPWRKNIAVTKGTRITLIGHQKKDGELLCRIWRGANRDPADQQIRTDAGQVTCTVIA